MRSLRKRITSLLLILVTLLTMVPTTAFAAVSTGTGITPTTDESWWAIRLTSTGQSYTYRPPLVAGKYLYCMDFGYSYRYGTPEFLNSYTYTAATGASADGLWDDAITQTGLGEMDAMTKENVKWMMSYIVGYRGEVPGALFMALQTYIWDHQSDKSAGADTSGDIDAGGYANADTYEIYLGYCDWLLEQKATEDAALQRKVEEYAAQGIQASIVEDDSTKWAILATSSVKGRQSFFAYYSERKVVADDEPRDEDNPPPPVAGDADLTFQKLSASTGRGLNGAVYNIYFNGTIIGTEVTSGGGYIELTGISTGLYSFVEQSAPEGYALDPTPHSVYVDVTDGDKRYTVTATDEKLPDMEIVKLDAQTGEEIEGAVFSVCSATGSYSTTVTTDRYGETSLEGLPAGVYIVKEVSVPEPYVASDTEQTVALVPGRTTTVTFTNYRSPGLEILKKHIATGDPIAHVTFKIEQLDGEYSTSVTTDSEGRIYLDSIPVGTYRITETNVPANVILCGESQTVTLKAGQTSTVTFHNAMKPSLLIRKVDSVTGDPIQGAKFSIQYKTTTGETDDLGTFYTDENGEIILTDVKRGWYKVTEVEPAKGYAIRGEASQEFYLEGDTIKTVTFENTPLSALVIYKYDAKTGAAIQGAEFQVQYLGNSGGTSVTKHTTTENGTITLTGLKAGTYIVQETKASPYYTLDDTPQTVVLTGNDQEAVTVEFANQPYGTVLIRKLSEKDNTPLAKATFLVTDDKGGFIGSSNGEFTTDAAGTIQIPKLPAGTTVVVKEIRAPEGYVLNSTPQTIRVEAGEVHSLTFYDESLSSLTVLKRDSETGKALADAEFTAKYGDGTMIGRYTTGSDGTFAVTGLTPGSTIVVGEVKAPDGYVLNSTPQAITVRSGAVNELVFENELQSQVIIRKVDSMTGKPLAGAQFKVVGAGDSLYMTDANGEVRITGLDPCTLTVTEVKAPNGHVLNIEPQVVTVKANETKTLTFANVPTTTLIIHKYIEGTDNEPLSGVAFKVTDSSGAVVGPDDGVYYTDDAGEIVLTGLEPGMTVCAREIKTVNGYVLNGTPQDIVIKAGEAQHLTFWNERTVSLTIEKLDSVVKKPLGGAEFYVTDADGTPIGSTGIYVSNSDGLVTIPNLRPGQVLMVTERKAPAGYVRDTVAKTVSVKTGAENKLIFENTPQGQLIIRKVDSATGKPLAGAQFKVTTSDGTFVGDAGGTITSNGLYTTDANGEIHITNLNPCTLVVTEVKAPDGYALDSESQTVKVNANDTQTLTFRNEKLCTLTVMKRDSITRKALAGAEFAVKYSDSSDLGGYITDGDGTFTVTGLLPGSTVVVSETKAPNGYVLDTTPKTISVRSNTANTLTFENSPTTTLIIHKYIEGTDNEPLSGVAFKVTDGSGAAVGPDDGIYYTDDAGEIVLSGLEPGTTVRVREIKSVDGYVLNGTPRDIVIKEGEAQHLTFWNERTLTLTIEKLDSVTKKSLPGAEFYVTDADGTPIGSTGIYVSDSDGLVTIHNLKPGQTLMVSERKAPTGYVRDTAAKTVTAKTGAENKLVFENTPQGQLIIRKVDSVTRKPLAGAQFKITTSDGTFVGNVGGTITSNGLYTTDANGQICITGLDPCTLVVTEVKAPAGYILDAQTQTVVVNANDTQTLTFTNTPKASLVIHKYIADTDNEPLSGVAFKVTDGSGKAIGTGDGIYYTDDTGRIELTGLEPGTTIKAQEIRTVDGYALNGTPQDILIEAGKEHSLTFWNEKLCNLTVAKRDSVTGKPLSGAEFIVKYGNGEIVGRYTTKNDGTFTMMGLAPGSTVAVSETKAPSGYVLDTTTQTITVRSNTENTLTFDNDPSTTLIIHKYIEGTDNEPLAGVAFKVTDGSGAAVGPDGGTYYTDDAGEIVLTGLEPDTTVTAREIKTVDGYVLDGTPQNILIKAGEVQELTFWNEKAATLTILKQDANTKKPLSGAEFYVTDGEGKAIGTSSGRFTTDANGLITITNLQPGITLRVSEQKAPAGYVRDDTPKTIVIKSGDENSLVFENEPQGQLIIQKLDSVTKEPLVGAQFKVTTSDGAFVGNVGGTITSNGLYTTNENGQIHITGLDPCTLVVTEVNAPDGYILDAQPQTVVVNANDTQTLTFANTPIGGLVIIKSDEDSGKRISGAKFEVRKMNGEVIGTYSTDRNGIIQLTELDSGWYTVTELKAASGYLTDSTLQQVEVKDGEMATLELTNRKASGVLLHKIDADTGEGIYGVTFLLYDRYRNPVGQYTTDQDGYIYVDEGLEDGRYYIREIDAADGYILDHEVKSIYIKCGSTTEIEWENTAIRGQIQIIKKSANDNPINGLSAGTLLEGAVFEIYDKAGNKVDTIRTDRNGRAISKLLPLSRYTIREVQAPDYYAVNPTVMTAYLEYEGQIVTFEVENESVSTGVNIKKTGYAEVMPGQPIKYTFSKIGNTSSVALNSFYWRDTLPGQVKLGKIVTGTYNQQLSYKIVYKTNLSEGYRTLADNLSTTRNYVLDASPTALRLAANERVTEVMFVFGAVKAGFGQVETPYIYSTVAAGLANGSGFVNTADAGGLYNGQWIMGVSRWVTKVYSKAIVTLPKTGY